MCIELWHFFAAQLQPLPNAAKGKEKRVKLYMKGEALSNEEVMEYLRQLEEQKKAAKRVGSWALCQDTTTSCVHCIHTWAAPQVVIPPLDISKRRISPGTKRQQIAGMTEDLRRELPMDLNRVIDLAAEKGASSWLSALPIRDHGFNLHRLAFRDAICLRYGWRPERMPDKCVCGSRLNMEHVLTYACGGFRSL